jgi:hypothetical protein
MEHEIRDLKIGAKFRLFGESYELLDKRPSGAEIRGLTPKRGRLPNGKAFERRPKPIYMSLSAVIEDVLE